MYSKIKCTLLFLVLAYSSCCQAQTRDSLLLAGLRVLDAFYETSLDSARISVLESDSCTVLADSMRFSGRFWVEVPRRDSYVLRINCRNYPVTYQMVKVPKKTGAKYVIEKPVYIFENMEVELGEAAVKASRILMVEKGDTLEFNAAAFRMSEGSMLDNLVRALPGVKLDDDGRITVNGEFVSSLLVNGRDFFKGDPRVALSNLPTYTVRKIQTYHKSEKAELMGKKELTEEERKKSPLVMDVTLKREYAKGWISNYEAGGGVGIDGDAGKKWLGRLFAMRYTNHSSLAVFAGTNSLSDAMSVSDKGEWKKVDAAEGETRTHMGGINLTLDPKDSPLHFSSDLLVKYNRHIGEMLENSETYYSGLTTARRSLTERISDHTDFHWKASTWWSKSPFFIELSPNVSYVQQKYEGLGERVEMTSPFMADAGSRMGAMEVDTLYSRRLQEQSCRKKWDADVELHGFVSFPLQQMISFYHKIDYSRTRENHGQEDLMLYTAPGRDSRLEYRNRHAPQSGYDYLGKILYENYEAVKKGSFKFRAFLEYRLEQSRRSARQELLESADDGLTPSVGRNRIWLTDVQNTYHTVLLSRTHCIDPFFDLYWGKFALTAHASMYACHRNIEDTRAGRSMERTANDFAFLPSISLSWDNKVHYLEIGGRMKRDLPEMIHLLDVEDTTDPLIVQRGNPALKPATLQNAYFTYEAKAKHHNGRLKVKAGFNRWKDRTAMAQCYDPKTGVTTLLPMNVDGNRSLDATCNYTATIDRRGNWSVSNELGCRLARSVDFSSAYQDQTPEAYAARNSVVKEEFRLSWLFRQMRIGTKVALAWTRQRSEQHLFTTLNYGTQGCGITFSSPIFWGIDLDTDLMVYGRNGFDDASMNTTDWVWNASLKKSLGRKKQWTVKVLGFDILRQLSNIRNEVNAQGFVERRYNTIPSYLMCNIMYRLDVKPSRGRR